MPPSPAKGLEKDGGIRIAGGLSSDLIQRRLKVLTLRDQQVGLTDATRFITAQCDLVSALGLSSRLASSLECFCIVLDGAQHVRHLTEGLEQRLLVGATRLLVRRDRFSLFGSQ